MFRIRNPHITETLKRVREAIDKAKNGKTYSIQHIFDIGVVVDMSFVKVENIDVSKVKEITLDDVYSEYNFDVVVECIDVVVAEMSVGYKVLDIGKGLLIHSKEWSVLLLKGDVKEYEDIIYGDDVKSKVH